MSADAMALPFDRARLDRRMDDAGVDLILATSKHNTQYRLGGYRCLFFAQMDALGLSRYSPVVGYPRGSPAQAFYVGSPSDTSQQELEPLWVPLVRNVARSSEQAGTSAAQVIRDIGLA